jgi:hypothetical protein
MKNLIRSGAWMALAAMTVACASTNQNRTEVQTNPAPTAETTRVPTTAAPNEVPAGQMLDVRLQDRLSSADAAAEDRFEATTLVDLKQGSRVLIPAGSVVKGIVHSANSAGRVDRTGTLSLGFEEITVRGVRYPIRAMATDVFKSGGYEEDAVRIGAGAAVGAIVGGILGGTRGALAGVVIGGGGVIAATEGQDVDLPAGSVVRVRFDSPLDLAE